MYHQVVPTLTYEGEYIYYFFKDAYSLSGDYIIYYLFGPIIGTVCVVGFLVLIIVSSAFSVVFFTKSFTDEKYLNKFTKASLTTYFAYICFVATFNWIMGYVLSSSGASIGLKLNGATVAGIVLTTIAMLTTLVFHVLCRTKRVNQHYIKSGVLTLLVLIFGAVALGLLSAPLVNINYSSYVNYTYSYGVLYIATYLYTRALYVASGVGSEFFPYYISTVAIIVAVLVATILFMFYFINMIKDLLVDFDQERSKRIYNSGMSCGILLIAIGVLQIVLHYSTIGYLFSADSFGLVVPIFTILLGIIFIVITVLSKKLLKTDNEVQNAQVTQ